MATLLEVLTGGMNYDPQWAVYAETDENGLFSADLPAEIRSQQWENGGKSWGRFFDTCMTITEQIDENIFGGIDKDNLSDEEVEQLHTDFVEEAAQQLIEEANASIAQLGHLEDVEIY